MNSKIDKHDQLQPRLLNVEALARLLDVSIRHVYRLADAGKMPRPLKIGGANRWDRIEIERWIAEGCRPVGNSRPLNR